MKAATAAQANAASRQTMLAEWIARLYAQAGREVLAVRARRALPLALREFEAGAKALLAGAGSPEVRENYRLLELLWIEYRPLVSGPPGLRSAERLLERHEELAWIAAKGERLMRDAAAPAGGPLHEAGEARLQSQRIARLHFYRGWATRSRSLGAELVQANDALRRALDTLAAGTRDAPALVAELQLAENQYSFLKDAARGLEGARDPRPDLERVAKTSDNMLEVLDGVAKALESASA